MRAVQVTRHGDPADVIEVREVEVPDPGPGEVRVAVAAASVNFGDIARTRGGVASAQAEPPFTLGMDVCGTVDAVGDGVDGEHVGRRVVAMTKGSFGGMAEAAICPVSGVFDAPAQLDDGEAAAFLLPFHTSHLALHRRARVQSGETVMVVGGASGVGTAAIQLAAAAGATVVALAGGEEKTAYCRELGAHHTIDYLAEGDLFDQVMELTEDRGVDVAVDLVGGDGTGAAWTCMAREGRYVAVGFNGEPEGGLSGKPLRMISIGNFSVLGVMLSYGGDAGPMRRFGMNPFGREVGDEVHEQLLELVASGSIRPAIGQRIDPPGVGSALADHEGRRTRGRTVVEFG